MCFPSRRISFHLPLQPYEPKRAFKDNKGRKHQPGLRELAPWLQDFRNLFIRRVVERVCLGETPWSNPNLASLQREVNNAYPAYNIRLHSDDAAVVPVSFPFYYLVSVSSQAFRPSVTLGSFETKLGRKELQRSSSTYQTSIANGC